MRSLHLRTITSMTGRLISRHGPWVRFGPRPRSWGVRGMNRACRARSTVAQRQRRAMVIPTGSFVANAHREELISHRPSVAGYVIVRSRVLCAPKDPYNRSQDACVFRETNQVWLTMTVLMRGLKNQARSKSRISASSVAWMASLVSSLIAAPSPWFSLLPFKPTAPRATCTQA